MKQCYYRFTAAAAVLLALALALCGCSSGGNQAAAEETDAGGSGGSNFWNSEENGTSAGTPANLNVTVNYSDFDGLDTWDDDACSIELHGGSASISGSGAEAEQREYYVVKITEGGTYVISGSLENGQIYVEAGENQVHLVLNGAKLSCKVSAPIYINNGRKTVITLAAGTENVLTDGTDYTYAVTESDEETGEITGEPNAALFSKKALTINGSGSLSVTGNFNNGITCKDELKIMNGTITVTAQNHGIRGNDFVVIKGGSIAVAALEGDGIKSTKEEHAEKGYVYIENGTLSVTAGDDGIQAANFAAVKDGSISIACGKDGIHADGTLSISGGTIDIEKSCEGLEGLEINISGGKIHLTAEDDGLNASAGSTAGTDGWRGFGGGGGMQYDSSCQIHLSGGYLYINADGDGIDSNGDLTISGGSVIINGPADSGNGALDANGTILVNGGFLVASGSSGMAEYPSGSSGQNVIVATLSQQQTGALLRIEDADGNDLLTFTSKKTYHSLIFSSLDIKSGMEYTVYTGGSYSGGTESDGLMADGSYTGGSAFGSVTVSTILSYVGTSGGMNGPGGMGGRPGRRKSPAFPSLLELFPMLTDENVNIP